MKVSLIRLLLILLISFVTLGIRPGLGAQGKSGDADIATSDTFAVKPIPATELIVEYERTNELISEKAKLKLVQEELDKYDEARDTIINVVDQFLEGDILENLKSANIRELDNALNLVDIYIGQIEDFQNRISKRSHEIVDASIELGQVRKKWEVSKEYALQTGVPDVVNLRINEVMRKLDSVNSLLAEDFTDLLIEEDALSGRNSQLKALVDTLSGRKELIGESLFVQDMPPFLEEARVKEEKVVRHHARRFAELLDADVMLIKRRFKAEVWFFACMVIVFIGLSLWHRRHFNAKRKGVPMKIEGLQFLLIASPVSTGLFVSTLLMRFLFKEFFLSLQVLNVFVLMLPLFIMVLHYKSKNLSPWVELLVALYVVSFLYEIIYYSDIFQRILLLFMSLAAFTLYLVTILKKEILAEVASQFVGGLLRFFLGIFALLALVGAIGNLAGYVRMAEYFTINFLQIAMVTLVVYVSIQVIKAFLYIILSGNLMQSLYLVREGITDIHKKISRLINLLLWIFLFVLILDLLNFKTKFMEWGDRTLNTGWKLGAVDISPASILIFIFVIWLSVLLSRTITAILEKDVFTRIPTPKGIPNTVSMLLKIALISGGFFLAAAAAGMELSNLSIIIGAFSVGIGFGLQNIFNNMVSGLILAFERPIKVGDTVQVGELMGVVLTIGFRASTIKSFDGAEVIVPNGNLISDSMVNWTLTDHLRRMDLRVGVAYGTDPNIVLEILNAVAEEHEEVRKQPSPSAFFLGFGDSSLDFRLLAWTSIDTRLRVESELNVNINTRLKEAGIEIPFPQRDLHIRSDDTKD